MGAYTIQAVYNAAGDFATSRDTSHLLTVNGPAASLSSTSLSFGSRVVGTTSASQSATLTNSGNVALSIASIEVTGADASSFVFANSCGTSLAACGLSRHFPPQQAPRCDGTTSNPICVSGARTGLVGVLAPA